MITLHPKLSRFVYTLLHYLALPGILVRLLWRSRYSVAYRQRWNERFGYIKRLTSNQSSIWVHAVSVGEAMAAIPLIRALMAQYPQYVMVVTTTTPTGSLQVIKHLKRDVMHVYSPYDMPSFMNRFLRRINAKLCIIMETELWPNMLNCCQKRRIPIMLANARLSERSKRNYRQIIPSLTKNMLASYSVVVAQGLLDGERFISLGLNPNRLIVSGNIKFDIQISEQDRAQGQALRQAWHVEQRPTIIAASTHEGEESILLDAFHRIRQQIPHAFFILAPRHPDRAHKIKRLCEDQGFNVTQRSIEKQQIGMDILLVDTIGELIMMYAASDIAFVGGSFTNVGGHNLIEPAAIGLPILTGPNLHNFTEISKILKKAGIAQVVNDSKQLATTVVALLSAESLCQKIGNHAREVVAANQGAVAKHMEWVKRNFLAAPTVPHQ